MNKPLIFISKCIEIDHCRYDGSQISSPFVKRLKKHVDILTVCPEVSVGLSIPREAIRIIDDGQERLVYSLTGTDVTKDMSQFSNDYMEQIKDTNIHGFILKNRSPSCGIRDIIRSNPYLFLEGEKTTRNSVHPLEPLYSTHALVLFKTLLAGAGRCTTLL